MQSHLRFGVPQAAEAAEAEAPSQYLEWDPSLAALAAPLDLKQVLVDLGTVVTVIMEQLSRLPLLHITPVGVAEEPEAQAVETLKFGVMAT